MGFIPGGDFLTPKALEVIKRAERKLTIIPMVFILLRIWGTIRFFRFLYYHPEDPPAIEFLVFLQVSRLNYYIMLLKLALWLYNNRARLYFISPLIILINENSLNDLKDAHAGARFSKAPLINGPVNLLLFTRKMEVSIVLQLT